tara:strand:+ start:1762 stop:3567 length:1806 start_codon:yes stop_codon:yes gene_type:complete
MSNYAQDIKVQYGSFTFPVPSPYVSKTFTNNYIGGNVFSTTVNVTLEGKIALLPKRESSEGNDYLKLSEKRDEILKSFAGALNKNFQQFRVSGHGIEDFILNNCTVDDVSFSSSNYVGIVGYTISLSGYKNDKDFYTANYGIINPVDSWQYNEDDSGLGSVVHNISASGHNTSGSNPDGFLKAKAFVTARKGVSSRVNQGLIRNAHPGSSLILNNVSETADRLGGRYSITENYSFVTNESSGATVEEAGLPSMQTANIMLTYSISVDEQQGGDFISMQLSGEITGSKDKDVSWDQIKSDFKSRNFYDLVNKAYKRHIKGTDGSRPGTTLNIDLNKDPVSFSINPNEDARTISFQLTFDNNQLFNNAKIKSGSSYFDYQIQFEHDNVTDIINVSCSGTIVTRGGLTKKNRDSLTLLNLMLDNNSKLVRDEAQSMYHKMFPSRLQYVLSPRPASVSVSRNEFDGTISYNASFSDADFPENSSLRDLNYSVNIEPAMQLYRSVPSCLRNGHYLIYDMKLKSKRETVGINTVAVADDRSEDSFSGAETEVVSVNDFIKDSFLDGESKRLNSQNKVENKDQSSITYDRQFSQQKDIKVIELNRLDT